MNDVKIHSKSAGVIELRATMPSGKQVRYLVDRNDEKEAEILADFQSMKLREAAEKYQADVEPISRG